MLENPNFIEQLHQNNSESVWEKGLPLFYIHWASTHQDELVRANLAYNHDLLQDILEKLPRDTSSKVRWSVARNSTAPTHILEQLARDSSYTVRITIAQKWDLPNSIIEIKAVLGQV